VIFRNDDPDDTGAWWCRRTAGQSAAATLSVSQERKVKQSDNPLGLHAFVPGFAEKAKNLTAALTDGRLRAIQAVARRQGP
jgi:hypothetical protein